MQDRDIRERTYQFSIRIVRLCQALDEDRIGRVLMSQILRAGTGIGANLEEGQAAQSKKDFISKVSIARKEAFEAHYWLRLLRGCGLIPEDRMADIIDECEEIAKVLSAIVLSAKKNP